ncbi:hypothetical protein A2U01_0095431, partial [Trifolium medium]|nr:hypothetical protein [Trifolium medium]
GSTVVIGTASVILEYRTSSGDDLGESLLIGEVLLGVDMFVVSVLVDSIRAESVRSTVRGFGDFANAGRR